MQVSRDSRRSEEAAPPEKRHRKPKYHKRKQLLSVLVQTVAYVHSVILKHAFSPKVLLSLPTVRLYRGAMSLISERAESLSYTGLSSAELLEDIASRLDFERSSSRPLHSLEVRK